MILPPDPSHPPQVTKIPVEGPAPFNTLVIVAGSVDAGGPGTFGKGVFQTTATFSSGYVLPKDDPRTAFVTAAHSTTAWISRIGPATRPLDVPIEPSPRFLYSLDDIASAGFTDAGEFAVQIDFSVQAPEPPNDWVIGGNCLDLGFTVTCANVFRVWVSSYLLVYESPLDQQQKHRIDEARNYRRTLPWVGKMTRIPPPKNPILPLGWRMPAPRCSEVELPCGCEKKA